MGDISVLLIIGSAILVAFGSGKAVSRLRFPMVVGYVLVGIVLGRSFLNILSPDVIARTSLLNDLALGIIAFLIGGELSFHRLKALGRAIVGIAVLECSGAFLVVALSSYLITRELYVALILGAVASATAPAATVAVINQYRARGPLTTTILGVVSSDDAIALMIYAFASALAYPLIVHRPLQWTKVIITPLIQILLSLLIGGALGAALSYLLNKIRSNSEGFAVTLGFLLVAEGIATQFDLSELLLVMAMAIVGANFSGRRFNSIVRNLNTVGFPLVAAFFCLAGARLNITLLPEIGFLGLAYLVSRMAGKFFGARLGATLSKAPTVVRKYIGMSLWPQIGVAVALAIVVEKNFSTLGPVGHHLASVAMNILLFTTVFTEIIGPMATKYALTKANEVET